MHTFPHPALFSDREQGIEVALRTMNAFRGDDPSIAFVLEHARAWTPRAVPKRYRRRRPQQCWGNSQLTLLDHLGRLTYVEGYARLAGHDLLLAHAWLVDGSGCVIDPTWPEPERAEYFGVPFRTDYVARVMSHRRVCWSLIDHRHDDWPIVDGREPIATAVLDTASMTPATMVANTTPSA